MRDPPPPALVDLLARLRLATPERVRCVRGRVRRLARDLPKFESVWVDALAQAGILTPFQASEINAGRGARLELGPFVLYQPLGSPGYVTAYRAREIATRRWVRLMLLPSGGQHVAPDQCQTRLETLIMRSPLVAAAAIAPVTSCGVVDDRLWIACAFQRGSSLADWIVHHGRFPPEAVFEIARQLLVALVACEQAGIVHGDVGAGQMLLDPLGNLLLPAPGLRGAVRPSEGFAAADLPPEAYDYLPPERAVTGTPPDAAGEAYACGCLWWHLLAGRPPVPGATALAKLRNAQAVRIPNVRPLAPDTPAVLALAIEHCVQRDPTRRPDSMARLAALLGPPSPQGHQRLARCARRSSASRARLISRTRILRRSRSLSTWAAAAAGAVLALALATWPQWSRAVKPSSNAAVARHKATPDRPSARPPTSDLQLPTSDFLQSALSADQIRKSEVGNRMPWQESTGELLELDGMRPVVIETLKLSAGQTVRGRAGQRPLLLVPRDGLTVDVEHVRFENVDFVWDHRTTSADHSRLPALVRLRAFGATFTGCSFQAGSVRRVPTGILPSAIVWDLSDAELNSHDRLPTGELIVSDSVFRGVAAAVRAVRAPALVLDLTNSLHLGPGPLLQLERAPGPDEPLVMDLTHVTLREAESLLEMNYERIDAEPGKLAVSASDCAFAPSNDGALLVFRGSGQPGGLLQSLEWTGQGSVLSGEAPLAVWRAADGRVQSAAEEDIPVEGLVRTQVGFAGEASDEPAASRIVRWQVPLHSTEPPGIGDRPLVLPSMRSKE